ncbi:MAG: hypothetical protein AAFV88_25925 [Planctomycetota bacterium]
MAVELHESESDARESRQANQPLIAKKRWWYEKPEYFAASIDQFNDSVRDSAAAGEPVSYLIVEVIQQELGQELI